jgi:hypothetical protein
LNRKRRASYPPDAASIDASGVEEEDEDGEEGRDGDVRNTAKTVTSPRPSKRRRFSAQSIAVPISKFLCFFLLPLLSSKEL